MRRVSAPQMQTKGGWSMAEAGGTLARIRHRLGHVPGFLNEVRDNPRALDALWTQTELCWLDNPLPELFKARILAYLSRFSRNPCCRVYHACRLWRSGVPAQHVAELLHRPAPRDSEIDDHLQNIREFAGLCGRKPARWPAEGSAEEWAVFWLAVAVFIGRQTGRACDGLREVFGDAVVADLMLLLSFARTMHEWVEAHPAVRADGDGELAAARKALEAEEPLFRNLFDGEAEAIRADQMLIAEAAVAESNAERRLAGELGSAADVSPLMRMPLPLMLYDEHGRVVEVNRAWTQLTGYSRDDTPTLAEWFSKAQPDVPCPTADDLEELFAGTALTEWKQTVRTRHGNPLVCDFTSAYMGRSAGGARLVMRVAVDMTQEDDVQRALERTRASLDAIVCASPLAIIALDAQDRCILWSPSAQSMFGWTQEEVLHKPLPTVPPEDQARMAKLRREVRTSRLPVQFEGERITKSGRRILVRAVGAPLVDALGGIIGVMAVFEDITEQRRQEEQAHQTGRFIEAVLRAVPAAVVAIDPDGVVRLWNAAAERIFGWSEAEVIGQPLPLIPPDKRDHFVETLALLVAGRPVPRMVRPCLCKDGSRINVDLLVAPVCDRRGRLTSLVGVMSPVAGGEH